MTLSEDIILKTHNTVCPASGYQVNMNH